MIKGYQGEELWTAMNPLSGKRQIVDPEGEFIPGETTIKQYYCKRFDGYVTVPGASLFKVAPDGCKLKARLTQSRLCVDQTRYFETEIVSSSKSRRVCQKN